MMRPHNSLNLGARSADCVVWTHQMTPPHNHPIVSSNKLYSLCGGGR